MLKKAIVLMGVWLVAGCASEPTPPPEPPPAPAPVIVEAEPPPAPEPEPPPEPEAPPRPQQTDTGRFRISIASLDSAALAGPWVQKAEAAGYRTELLAVELDGKTWHRVLLPGYASLDEARAAIPFVEQDLGVQDAWVTSRLRAPSPEAASSAEPDPEPTPKD